MKKLMVILAVVFPVFVAGCTSQSIRDKPTAADYIASTKLNYLSNGTNYTQGNFTYMLLPMKGSESELKNIKTGKEIKKFLKASGMEESNNPDMIIFFDFGGGEVTSIERSIPYAIKGQTGISSATTTGAIYSGGNINLRTTVTPTYGTIGYGENKYTTHLDSHHLALLAIDANIPAKGDPTQLWLANVGSSGSLFDEDLSLRVMLMASKHYIGKEKDASSLRSWTRDQIVNP